MWTLDEARAVVGILQPHVKPLGYHVALGGGVLNRGYSDKDVDLYFLPLDNPSTQPEALAVLLGGYLGEQHPLGFGTPGANYGPHPTYGIRATYIQGPKRVDVFII
jgi:hypothetical protein